MPQCPKRAEWRIEGLSSSLLTKSAYLQGIKTEVVTPMGATPPEPNTELVVQTGSVPKRNKKTHRGSRGGRSSGFRNRAIATQEIATPQDGSPWIIQAVVMGKLLDISGNNEALLSLMSTSAAMGRDVLVTLVQLAPVSGVYAYSTSLLRNGGVTYVSMDTASAGEKLEPVTGRHAACAHMYNALVRGKYAVLAAMQCYRQPNWQMTACPCKWMMQDLGQWHSSTSQAVPPVTVSTRVLFVEDLPDYIQLRPHEECKPFHHGQCDCRGKQAEPVGILRRLFCLGANPVPLVPPASLVDSLSSLRIQNPEVIQRPVKKRNRRRRRKTPQEQEALLDADSPDEEPPDRCEMDDPYEDLGSRTD